MKEYLHRNCSTVIESLSNKGIKIDIKILLQSKGFVSVFDFLSDPVSKWFTCNGVYNIDDPLFGHLKGLFLFRKLVHDGRNGLCSFEDILSTEAFVLGDMEMLDSIALDKLCKKKN